MTDMSAWEFLGSAFVTLFVIMDPPGNVPVFLALTPGRTRPAARGRPRGRRSRCRSA